jgi:hypothetical protein
MRGIILFAARRLLSPALCLLGGHLLCGPATAETIVFAGDYGLNRQQPKAADLYDARGATVQVEQGTNNTCWNIRPRGAPDSAVFIGGRCIGVGHNRTMDRKPLYDRGNGAGLRFEHFRDFTVRRFYTEYAWDPIRPANGYGRDDATATIEESWIRSGRDDCVEADTVPARLTIRNSLIEDCHSMISVRPGGGNPLPHPITIEITDSLLSLGCKLEGNKPCLERELRAQYPWARKNDPATGQGGRSNSVFFKLRNYDKITIVFKGNSVAMGAGIAGAGPDRQFYTADDVWQEIGFHTPERNLDFFLNGPLNNPGVKLDPASTGNTFYWLGGCDFAGLTMVQLHGACVPAEFKLDPAVWTAASNSRTEWLDVRARWISEVWQSP